MNEKIKKLLLVAVIILITLLIVSGVVWGVIRAKKPAFLFNALIAEKASIYSLVYIQTGGNTTSYYGQIINDNEEFIILKNPGYINIEEAAEEGENPVISFRQMKDESIKPLPEMKIYKHNIIFIQELSTDSPIIQAYEGTNK
jgi:hypothetical protein